MKEYIIKVNMSGKLANECLNVLDAKELVRCGECKHGCPLTDSAYIQCTRAFHTSERHGRDWFCADGELKD